MSNLLKLGLAAALAAGAVILNLWWLNSRPKDPTFTSVKRSIKVGETITEADLVEFPIPGKHDELRKSFIPWDDRMIIFDRPAVRDFTLGDPLLQRDIEVGAPQYDVIGPFRIVSVGEALREKTGEATGASESGGSANTVTVLVRHYLVGPHRLAFDEKTRRLLQLIDSQSSGSASRNKQHRAIAATSYPKGLKLEEAPAPEGAKEFREIHLIVPIEDVSISQKVLAVGDDIGFVVPTKL